MRRAASHRSVSILTLLLAAATVAAAEPPAPPATRDAASIAAEVLAAIDPEADPCVDFYQYACGNWRESSAIPSDRTRWVRSFSVIDERNQALLHELLDDAATAPGDAGSQRRKVGDYFAACMDEAAIEAAGTKPLDAYFARIAAVDSATAAFRLAGELHRDGFGPFLWIGRAPDFKHPDRNQAFLIQGGLGMPDRDYYVSADARKRELLAGYERHLAAMLVLVGQPGESARADARAIVAFETELAGAARPREALRDPARRHNPTDRAGLAKQTPHLAWDAFFSALGYSAIDDLNVATPEFFARLDSLLAETPLATLQSYLRWVVLREAAELLPRAFVDERFTFFGRAVRGQAELEPRWKRCVDATEDALGEAVGKLYVERQFAGTSKQVAEEMIGDIYAAFESSLPGLAWMDDTTRQRALAKMKALREKVGYPERWRDYRALAVARGSYFASAVAAARFERERQLSEVGRPVDLDEWRMPPQMVNAYYSPQLNEIAFPAGILQPPFFHRDFPGAMNYGAIGAVIGHELSHGFDDQGRKFDPRGELREWWEPAVAERFERQAACVDGLYSGYAIDSGEKVNGKLTLGENIADVGGLKQAYLAYQRYRDRHPDEAREPASIVPGLTDDQLFFVAFGQVWCSLVTPEEARLRIVTDTHAPGQFRVRGPVSQNPWFGPAFGCAPNTPMHPTERCVVW